MARIPLVAVETMTPEQRAQYDRFPSNLTRALLVVEPRLARALPELANALRASGFDRKWREGVILRVAALSGSAYERMEHLEQAQKVGWRTAEIAAIEAGDAGPLPDAFAALMAFVEACVSSPRVADSLFAEARSVVSDRDLATVILLVGHYMMIARYLETLDVELDPTPDSWTSEH